MAVSVKGALNHVIHVPSHYPSVPPSPQPSGDVGLLHGDLLSLLNQGTWVGVNTGGSPASLVRFRKAFSVPPSQVSEIFLKCSALALNLPNTSL